MIIQKTINPQPETVWHLEETGENYRSEESAQTALNDYLVKLDRLKINALINEVLFGCVWVNYYGENALIRPDLNQDKWFRDVNPSIKYNYDYSGQRGVLNFHDEKNFSQLLGKLIQNGVEVAFTGSEGESGFLMHDCQPGIIISLDKSILAFEHKMNEELIKATHEYCLLIKETMDKINGWPQITN